MGLITLFLALGLGLFVWFAKPAKALGVYIGAFAIYPAYLTIPIGTLDFSLGRLLVVMLLARILLLTALPSKFRLSWMDLAVLAAVLGEASAFFANAPARTVIEREGGTFFDTALPYFAARLTIRSRDDLVTALKYLIGFSLPLAGLGLLESFTSVNLYARAASLGWHADASYRRMGLYRASASFQHPIEFGLHMAAVFFLLLSLWYVRSGRQQTTVIGLCIVFVGLFSALSSAPLFALVAGTGFVVLFYFRRYWLHLVIAAVLFCLAVELYSDRHFYHVLTRFAMSGSTAYYRIGLIEEALGGGMKGHWLLGYGYVGLGPNVDNSNFHWFHKDLLNIYIAKLARTGLVGVVPYLLVNVGYYWFLGRAFHRAKRLADRWMIWCLTATLVSWNIAMMTVGPLNKNHTLLYIMIGFAVAAHMAVEYTDTKQPAKPVRALEDDPSAPDPSRRRLTDQYLNAHPPKPRP